MSNIEKDNIIEKREIAYRNKRGKTKLSKKEKIEVAKLEDKYIMLFHIIFKVGNKVMLEPQLVRLCTKFRLLGRDYEESTIRKVLKRMEKLNMIEIKAWQQNPRCNMIIMKDPYITKSAEYFTELLGYHHGATKENTEGQYNTSVCRTQYLINMLHPNTIKKYELYTAEDIFKYLDKHHSLYYQRGRGLEYLRNLNDTYKERLMLSNKEYEDMRKIYEKAFNNLLSRNVNVDIIDIQNQIYNSQYPYSIPIKRQTVTIRIDAFDTQNRVSTDSILTSVAKTIDTFNLSLDKRLELVLSSKCKGCNDYIGCIYAQNADTGEYCKYEDKCTENIYVLDRNIKYVINLYSYNEHSSARLRNKVEKDRRFASGESAEESVLSFYLSSKTGVPFTSIEVNYKHLDIDRLYIKGNRAEKFKSINEARREGNLIEAIIKKTTKNNNESELSALVKDIQSLPDDLKDVVITSFRESLFNSLETVRDEINTTNNIDTDEL